ncbi:MAG: Ni/Fe hydrogenase subunit alpha [Nanoarchaeota archaeon]|nr:Ni/Fe hydrogenase subunit alpha [Nanoarchaeota archaeon]
MSKLIKLDHLAKVEGHASLVLKIEGSKVKKCELQVLEGARLFEELIKGRTFNDVQEIVSRICGICSSAHTVAAVEALENALKLKVSEQTKVLRELLMLGERIRSNVTHLYFLALPDYLGYDSALSMLKDHKNLIKHALKLMKLGNEIISTLGGREIHPLNIQVGGITKLPSKEQVNELLKKLEDSQKDFIKTAHYFLKLKYPKFERETDYFSLYKENEYASIEGDLICKSGIIKKDDYKKHIKETFEDYSTSKFAVKEGKSYMVGALARMNNNYKILCKEAKLGEFPSNNPFHNNIAQAIELIHLNRRVIDLLKKLDFKDEKIKEVKIRDGHGVAAVEAPRGVLFHEYKISKGIISYANIITPTVQNLRRLEEDIKIYVEKMLDKSKEEIVLNIEKLIRAYDPCFSCSSHFLEVTWE